MELDRPLWVPTRIYIPGQEQTDLTVQLPYGGPMFRKGDTFHWDNEDRKDLQGRWRVTEVAWELDTSGGWCQNLIVEKKP